MVEISDSLKYNKNSNDQGKLLHPIHKTPATKISNKVQGQSPWIWSKETYLLNEFLQQIEGYEKKGNLHTSSRIQSL